ncbi:MAG: hypothetical protein IIA87_03995 [Nanoarchaeota archaeon]|nr:hypothetical protein [Nanoarchaeota archaeon]
MGLIRGSVSLFIEGGSSLMKYGGLISGIYWVLSESDNVNYFLVGGCCLYLGGGILSRANDIILSVGTRKDIEDKISSKLEERVEDDLYDKEEKGRR